MFTEDTAPIPPPTIKKVVVSALYPAMMAKAMNKTSMASIILTLFDLKNFAVRERDNESLPIFEITASRKKSNKYQNRKT